ncbi:hypothetical protein [Polyangium mundeleinium]|uniref:Uncharacterized protein n=1 Tax=Polyangium mundeleinium TaxID=2995306 RepID=A0ABT5EW93_9BACT|nr:hypothetical protein [Polyangium mundeleinium]MDC0746060.1 hypothetical protein [Polyangium mundeleinium]
MALLLLAALAPLFAASRADADPEPPRPAFRLQYAVAPSTLNCPPASSLAALINSKFGYDLFPDDARATLAVTIRPKVGQFEAELRGLDAAGATQWQTMTPSEAPTCATLVEALALRVFMQFATPIGELPPAWTLRAPPPPLPVPPPVPPPSSGPPPLPQASAPVIYSPPARIVTRDDRPLPFQPSAWTPRLELSAAFVAGFLDTPHVALGGAGQIAVRWDAIPFVLAFEGRGVVDPVESIEGISGHHSLLMGTLLACFPTGRFRACAFGSGGVYDAAPVRGRAAQGRVAPVAGFGFRGAYDLHRSDRIILRLYADVFAPTLRASSSLGTDAGKLELWTMSVVLPSVGFAVVKP